MNNETYKIINETIMERLESAKEKGYKYHWIKPWSGTGPRFPCSYDLYLYKGINQLLLDNDTYITKKKIDEYNQKNGTHCHIKKGCKARTIYFFQILEKKDKDGHVIRNEKGKPIEIPYLKFYHVFAREDVEGLPSLFTTKKYSHTTDENFDKAETYINAYCKSQGITLDIIEDGTDSCFIPSQNRIKIPKSDTFKNLDEYYRTIFHELAHQTGVKLKRKIKGDFGSDLYSKEELVAEITSCYLANEFSFVEIEEDVSENQLAYINGWLSVLKEEDKTFLVSAATQAQKAADYIIREAEKKLYFDLVSVKKEVAYALPCGYLYVQMNTDGNFEYSLFDEERALLDGGVIERSIEIPDIITTAKDLLTDLMIDEDKISEISPDSLMDEIEK